MPVAPSITIRFDKNTVVNNRGSSADQSEPVDWLLDPSHSESYFASVIIFPRPDSETTQFERNRVNYPGQPYRIPIVVHGGRPPFKFTLTNAPAGMSIGETLVSDGTRLVRGINYGIVHSAALAAGTYNLTARVEDQAGVVRTVTWQVVSDASQWNVLDTTALTNGTGTMDSPFKLLSAINNGKPTLVLGNIDWTDKVDPIDEMSKTWVAASGFTPDMLQASSSIGNNPGTAGLWFSGFNFAISPENNGVNQFIRFEGMSRVCIFENTIDLGNEPYTLNDHTENVSVFMWADQQVNENDPANGKYNFLYGNAFKNVKDRDLFLGYSMRFSVVENNSMEHCTEGDNGFGHGFYFKINCSDVTFRGNYSIGDENTAKLLRVDAYTGYFNMDRYDICYNNERYFGEEEAGFGYCHEFHNAGHSRYFYRNTSFSANTAAMYLRGMGAGDTVHFSNNVFVSGGTNTNGIRTDQFEGTVENVNYLAGNLASGILDSNNHLAGSYVTNLGLRGSEIK